MAEKANLAANEDCGLLVAAAPDVTPAARMGRLAPGFFTTPGF